jgi:hypothetical protein
MSGLGMAFVNMEQRLLLFECLNNEARLAEIL